MNTDPKTVDQPASNPGPRISLLTALVNVALAVTIAILSFWLGTRRSPGPGPDSPEVGFARDMMTHHAQAVDMATLLRDRTADPALKQFALDIMLTQQGQIGQMRGWLDSWGHPVASTGPAMAWMGMPTTGRMPGMASPEDLNRLRNLSGEEADGLFLQLMIVHHRAGVAMGEAILSRTDRSEVRALAQSIVAAQAGEVAFMQELLQQKGFPPVPEQADLNHGDAAPSGGAGHDMGDP